MLSNRGKICIMEHLPPVTFGAQFDSISIFRDLIKKYHLPHQTYINSNPCEFTTPTTAHILNCLPHCSPCLHYLPAGCVQAGDQFSLVGCFCTNLSRTSSSHPLSNNPLLSTPSNTYSIHFYYEFDCSRFLKYWDPT